MSLNLTLKRVFCVQLLSLEEKLVPLVLSALEEDAQTSRLFACRSLSIVLELTGSSLHPDALNKIYPRNLHRRLLTLLTRSSRSSESFSFSPFVTADLLKRLDDSSEEVRSVALRALGLWLSGLTEEYNPEWCAAHLQLLFQQLLLHLDDPDSSVQEQVLGEARVSHS